MQRKETVYSVVLGAVSIQDDKNSYYKLQVLEHDKKPKVDCLQLLEIIAFLMPVSKLFQYEIDSMGVGKKKYRNRKPGQRLSYWQDSTTDPHCSCCGSLYFRAIKIWHAKIRKKQNMFS